MNIITVKHDRGTTDFKIPGDQTITELTKEANSIDFIKHLKHIFKITINSNY